MQYHISGRALGFRKLRQLMDAWAATAEPQIIRCPPFAKHDGARETYIFGRGSVRGVSVRYHGAWFSRRFTLDLRLSPMASHTDWRLCFAFMRLVLAAAGDARIEREDGAPVPAADITDDCARREAAKSFVVDTAAMMNLMQQSGRPGITLANPHYQLALPPAAVPANPSTVEVARRLEVVLARQAERYEMAHLATVVNRGFGRRRRKIAVWPISRAVLVRGIDQIVFPAHDGMKCITPERAAGILRQRMEQIDTAPNTYYLPELNLQVEENALLYERLMAAGENLD